MIDQHLCQLEARFVVESGTWGQQQFCLRRKGIGNDRGRVAKAIHGPALHEVEIAFAGIVPQKGAFAADKDGLRARGDVHQGVERICSDIHVETPLQLDEKKAGQNERRPHVAGATFSKTLLI